MITYIQTSMFPELDRRLARQMPRTKRTKRLPIEKALDLFPRREKQLVFADYFPGFEQKNRPELHSPVFIAPPQPGS